MRQKYVQAVLCDLPRSLDATYERMLHEIDEIFRPEAIILLRWLAYAKRPISLKELAQAAAIEVDSVSNSVSVNDPGDPEDTLRILGALVMVGDPTWRKY